MGASGFSYVLNAYDASGKRGPDQFCKQFHFIPRNNVVFASFCLLQRVFQRKN